MADITLEEVKQMIARLSPEDRQLLVHSLNATDSFDFKGPVTRESVLAEHVRRVASGAFDRIESLRGRYARSDLDLSFEDIEAAIHEQI